MPILKTVTLGCKVNQYETQYMREGFKRLGYQEAVNGQPVDLIVLNSCTVTAESEAKCRKIIRRLAKKNPRAEIIVMGCYATRAPDEATSLPGVVEVIQDKRELPDLLARRGLKGVPNGISSFFGRHRAWVKIQDGCREKCSYCIIPLVRPVLASRPAEDVLEEILRLVDAGFAEIVLTGIHLGHYGADFRQAIECQEINDAGKLKPGHVASAKPGRYGPAPIYNHDIANLSGNNINLTYLLQQIVKLGGEFRVRLSSIEAAEVTPELLELMAEHPQRICPHLHLPLQSGSDRILRKMRRRWTVGQFIEQCDKIRERLDQPAFTTDVMVGFPGETAADFIATCQTVEKIGFSKIHVFRFSPRPGTEAAALPNHVPQRIHQQWAAELAKLEKRLLNQYLDKLLGRPLQVLVEGMLPESPGKCVGTADRYITVEFFGSSDLISRLINVKADKFINGCLYSASN